MSRAIEVGQEIPATNKVVYQRAFETRKFSDDSIHNDDHTQKHGYPGALISAYVLMGYMSEPMVNFFGASWFTSGQISLKFVGKGVQQGDRVRCRGTVRRLEHTETDPVLTLDVWMEKSDGTKAVVGEARCVLPDAARHERRS